MHRRAIAAVMLLVVGCSSDSRVALPPLEPFRDLEAVFIGMRVAELRELRAVSFAPYTGLSESYPGGGTILYHVRHVYTDHAEPSGRQRVTAVAFSRMHTDAASAKRQFNAVVENWKDVLGAADCELDRGEAGTNLLWRLDDLTAAAALIGAVESSTPPAVQLRISRDTADLRTCRGMRVD